MRDFLVFLMMSVSCIGCATQTVAYDGDHGRQDTCTLPELESMAFSPGDTVFVKEGTYENTEISVFAEGTEDAPVVIMSERPGKSVITGTSSVSVGGSHIVFSGFVFRDCDTREGNALFNFRQSPKRHAYNCVLKDCLFSGSGQKENADKDIKWVSVYGSGNTVEHCSFIDKKILGSLLVVWVEPGTVSNHRITGNYFTHPFVLTDNEGKSANGQEMIRIGTSAVSMSTAGCTVENNLFYRCNGEVEIISSKSCGNIYRGNVFEECKGTLTLRHGNGCIVEKNIFIGNGVPETGGVRIIGERHTVAGNWFEGLRGTDQRSAVSLVRGIENSELSGYFQVKEADVHDNVILDCRSGIVVNTGNSASTMPVLSSRICSNTVVSDNRNYDAVEVVEDYGPEVEFSDNRVYNAKVTPSDISYIKCSESPLTDRSPADGVDRDSYGVTWNKNSSAAAVALEDVPAAVRKAAPGDTVTIADGVYRDVLTVLTGKGKPRRPIVVMAETPGGVIVEGRSYLRLSGEWLEVSGLWFRNGCSLTGTVIEFRNGSEHAYDCRVTGCVIDHFNPASRQTKGNWVQLYGKRNRFDHNTVVGKLNEGVVIAAVLDLDGGQYHRIDHNYFGPRPVYGSNGAEIIRTGNSFSSHTPSFIEITDNWFDRCCGEVETLSIKSCDNRIERNVLFECMGGIALRHGDRNIVSDNIIIGNGKPDTGGVRVINKGHVISGNWFCGLAGKRSYSPLAIMNGVPDSPDYRYHQVRNTVIKDNIFENCGPLELCLGKDFERTEAPRDNTFSDNIIVNPMSDSIYVAYDDISGILMKNNIVSAASPVNLPDGFVAGTADFVRPAVPAKGNSGASWFSWEQKDSRVLSGKTIDVAPGQNSLYEAVLASAPGDVLRLDGEGEYWNDRTVVIPHYLKIEASDRLESRPVLRYNGKGGEPLLMIADGGQLDIKGIGFNGIPDERLRDPKGFITTAPVMIHDFTLSVRDCEFSSFDRSGTYAISCTRGSFAPWVEIKDCIFRDLPWDAIVLSKETDFYGRYNVHHLTVKDCLFSDVGGKGIDIARWGYDESTSGPVVDISGCTFRNVFNREQGSVIDLSGVQKARVEDCSFDHSGQGGTCIRLNEMRWDDILISDCNLYESGKIHTFWPGKTVSITGFRPCYDETGYYTGPEDSGPAATGSGHPKLMLTAEGISRFRSQIGANPLTDAAYRKAKSIADAAVSSPLVIPEPKDVGGGYSHEKHKSNYTDMYNAGVMYQLTGDERYAEYVRKMLKGYADMYPDLPVHPARFTKTPGKIFYQVLNEAVWLVYAANAYDCVYDYIPADERKYIESNLFRPMVDFMENGLPENRKAFNSMHNFGTWMTAGTAMIGYVMNDEVMVKKALYGSDMNGSTGFLRQLDVLFSPDGYYDEGPGYQRYAIFPFVTLAECIDRNDPGLEVFRYRNGILGKAVNTLLQCTYEGDVFLMNDAIQKNIHTYEILFSTNIAYKSDPSDTGMLGMIERQGIVTLTDAGALASEAIAAGQATDFRFRSGMIASGPEGKDGGLGIIRFQGQGDPCVTLKATTHGGGHGHFDRLSIMYFNGGVPVIPDYGSARFINVVSKAKGGYAPENTTFAKQSIAHNTMSVDSSCHFGGVPKEALKESAKVEFYDFSDPKMQIMSASDTNAYPGVRLCRTVALLSLEKFDHPVVLDIFRASSDSSHVYDLPYYYNGHLMSVNFGYDKDFSSLSPMGTGTGYRHLWKEASGIPSDGFTQLTWLENGTFYTLNSWSSIQYTDYLVKTGANDPDYNLVTRNGILLRNVSPEKDFTVVSVIEPHGNYDLVTETTVQGESGIIGIRTAYEDEICMLVEIRTVGDSPVMVGVSKTAGEDKALTVEFGGREYSWDGYIGVFE